MPRKTTLIGGPLAAVGTVRNFMTVMKEISFDEEREQAERMPRILIIAADLAAADRIGDDLTGTYDSPAITAWTSADAGRAVDAYDVVVVHDPASNNLFLKVRQKAGRDGAKIFDLANADGETDRWAEPLRERITAGVPDLAPALGRWFPAFRPAATKAVIDETARVNAQFALVSNVPAVIPIVGSLAAAGADFFVLTKNQVMMVFKVAAIHGADLRDQWQIIREMIPVVGAGLLWRTLAREAASFIPFAAGTVPKVLIAYTGTVAAGRGAEFYYRFGEKPTRDQLRDYYEQAAEAFKRLPISLPRRTSSDDSAG
jgi:uncharacterized protein (DUF697 family)